MKKCLCCSNNKLFMKLKDGLCINCYDNLKKCETNYTELLNKVNSNKYEPTEVIYEISLLISELKRYDDINSSIKSFDCVNLLNTVNNNLISTNVNYTQNDISTHSLSSTNSINSSFVDAEDTFKLSLPSNIKCPINDITISDDLFNNIDNTSDIIIDNTSFNLDTEHTNENIDSLTLPSKETIFEPIKKIINPELYDCAKEILYKIKDELIAVDELCYQALLLKNTYMPLLTEHNITTIDDIDILETINSALNKASLLLHCNVSDIYSFYNYVAFSIQTTGLKIESNDIVELCAVKVSYGKIEDTFHTLINPGKTISRAIEKKIDILNTDLENAPSINVVLQDFITFISDLNLISYNSNFNYGFLKYNYTKVLNTSLDNDSICLMKLYRTRYKQYHGEPTKNFSLSTCCEDILSQDILSIIENEKSIALSSAIATYNSYEILKTKYK